MTTSAATALDMLRESAAPERDARIDKQNRGKTGVTMRQFLIGQFFDIRDVDIQRTKLDY